MEVMVVGNMHISDEQIEQFCRRRRIVELGLFGSVLHRDFCSDSDVDVLVTFAPDCGYSSFDLAEIQNELEQMLGRKVDLVEKAALKNPFRRSRILADMEVVYAA
jgi:predicted nucleotidyltransferase